jgi:hypothetical protein
MITNKVGVKYLRQKGGKNVKGDGRVKEGEGRRWRKKE